MYIGTVSEFFYHFPLPSQAFIIFSWVEPSLADGKWVCKLGPGIRGYIPKVDRSFFRDFWILCNLGANSSAEAPHAWLTMPGPVKNESLLFWPGIPKDHSTAPGKFLLISSFKRCRGKENKRFLMKGCLPGDSVPAFKRDDLSAGTTPRRRP